MLNSASSPFWKQLCGIDLRTLALFRVALVLAIMANLINLLPDVFAFFSDGGLIPRADAMRRISPYAWSLYFISGHVAWAYALLLATLLSTFALLIGYHTRLAVVVCWILIASLTTRITIATTSADMQLMLLLFWAMFLPLGARFSVDAALSRSPKAENAYVSWATLAVMLQVGYLYFFGALLKTGSFWRETYDAIYYVLNSADINSPLAPYMPPWFEAMRWLTWYVYYLELFAIFVLFSPVRNTLCRLAILPFLITLHIGFALLLTISFFPAVSLAGLMVFVPGVLWDRLLPWFNARPRRAGIKIYRLTARLLPEHERDLAFQPYGITQAFIAVLVVLVLAWNINTLPGRSLGVVSTPVTVIITTLRLGQSWQLFSPQPWYLTQWTVIEGHLADGAVIDLLHEKLTPPSHARPAHGYAAYPSQRWRKLLLRLHLQKTSFILGRYFCSVGEDILPSGRPPMREMAFTVYRQFTPPPEMPPPPVIKLFDFRYDCLRKRAVPVKAEKPAEKNKKAKKTPLQ